MKELDLSAGGFPERTYVGKNTTVADVVEYIRNMRAQHVREIEKAVLAARIEELHEWGCCVCDAPPFDGCPTCSREAEFRAALAAFPTITDIDGVDQRVAE